MKKLLLFLLSLMLLSCALLGCAQVSEETVRIETVRGTLAPATVALPRGDGPFPLVVLAHGYGGERNQGSGFIALAEALAKRGVASLRIDFPGSGDSAEDSAANSLSAMKADVRAAIAYAIARYPVDETRVGVLGYSLGGRLALELMAEEPDLFSAAALLAPAADTEDLKGILGGPERWALIEAEANAAPEGYAAVRLDDTRTLHLSTKWFSDLAAYPGASSAERAGACWDGAALVLYSPYDDVISPAVSQYTANCLGAETYLARGDGHGFGFYGGNARTLQGVCKTVSAFFARAFSA